MKKTYPFLLTILLLFLLPGCNEEKLIITPSGNAINIGVIGPMSGPYKALGENSMQGIQTALHMHPYLNNGDSIKLIVEDDQNEPELTVKALKKLVETDHVEAVLLLSTSAPALAVNAIADNYQVPVLVLMATHPDIGLNSRFVIQICFDNTFQGNVAALFVRDELLIERVAAMKNPASFYSSSLVDAFVEQFSSIEGQITDVVAIEAGTTAYEDILQRLRDQKVQLLYLPVATEHVIGIAKALQTMDWNPQVMGGDNFLNMVMVQQEEKFHYLDGFLVTDLYSNTDEITPYGKRAAKTFKSLFKSNNTTLPASGFEGMVILLHAMNRCSAPKSKCINTRLHDTVEFEGIMGNISIRKNGKAERPLIINRIQGREMEFVVKVY